MTLPPPYPRDVVSQGIRMRSTRKPPEDLAERYPGYLRVWQDEWGVTWASLTEFDKGEVIEGAIRDWSELDAYKPPDLSLPQCYEHARQGFAAQPDKYRIGGLPGFCFNIARKLRKLENYLCDLIEAPENVHRLHGMIRAQLEAAIDNWARVGADGVMFPEDWGMQDRLLIDPGLWREMFKDDFRRLCARAHGHGMHVLMHSCGYIFDIIEDLCEVGIDCLQLDQPRLLGIDRLAECFGGRMSFWCPVDIQRTLQSRDEIQIAEEARYLIERLGRYGGGFVAGYYGSNEALGLDPKYQDIACRTFVENAHLVREPTARPRRSRTS